MVPPVYPFALSLSNDIHKSTGFLCVFCKTFFRCLTYNPFKGFVLRSFFPVYREKPLRRRILDSDGSASNQRVTLSSFFRNGGRFSRRSFIVSFVRALI